MLIEPVVVMAARAEEADASARQIANRTARRTFPPVMAAFSKWITPGAAGGRAPA